jgi:hypothetical protein
MRKMIGGTVAALALVAVAATSALANDHLTPGTPGTPRCRGQTVAYLAQAAKNGLTGDALNAMGIGRIANWANLSVKEVQAVVDQYCAG